MNRSGSFLGGIALGVVLSLAALVAHDRMGLGLPSPRAASAESPVPDSGRTVVLADALPEGIEVTVDGAVVSPESADGVTRVAVSDDARRLQLRGPHGLVWAASVAAGAPDTLRPHWGGEILVEVEPQGPTGTLLLDGMVVGEAPGSVDNVPPGWHVVAIRSGDRVLFQDACRVVPGRVARVSAPPPPPKGKGRLLVRSRTWSALGETEARGDVVSVDGEPRGETPLELELPAGFHSVSVRREGYDPQVDVLYLPAGQTRHAEAGFGREDVLRVEALLPSAAPAGFPAAVPVRVDVLGETVTLTEGSLHVVQPGRTEPLAIPLVASATDPGLWVGVIPAALLAGPGELTGYARAEDDRGRAGVSEIFRLTVK